MGRSRLMWFGVMAALVFAARGASAQAVGAAFGQKGQVAISAERLLGVYVKMAKPSRQDGTIDIGPGGPPFNRRAQHREATRPSFVLLGSDDAVGPAAIPRLGVDFFVIDRLSIGGSLLYWTDSSDVGDDRHRRPGGSAPEHDRHGNASKRSAPTPSVFRHGSVTRTCFRRPSGSGRGVDSAVQRSKDGGQRHRSSTPATVTSTTPTTETTIVPCSP